MTQDDIERRIGSLERRVSEVERGQVVLTTAVALARWLVPLAVSIAAVVLVFLK